MLTEAHEYADRGWPVFPLKAKAKVPATRHGFKEASTDHAQIEKWWKANPARNVALVTGHAFDVLDLDSPDAADVLPGPVQGPTVHTGKGRHVYVEATGAGNRAGVWPHVDWRGQGGYVVAPPSVHPSGAAYCWDDQMGENWPLEPAPGWLAETLAGKVPGRAGAYGRKALAEEAARVRAASEGTRNDTLNLAAFNLGQLVASGDVDRAEAVVALDDAAAAAGLGDRERVTTIASGVKAGMANPRTGRPQTDRAAKILAMMDAPEATGHPVNVLLGVPGLVHRFTREMAEAPGYAVHGGKGTGRLTGLQLSRPDALRAAIAAATGQWIEAPPGRVPWTKVTAALMSDVEEVDLGDEATDAGRGRQMLRAYLNGRAPSEEKTDAVMGLPFMDEGRVHVVGAQVRKWIRQEEFEHLGTVEFGRMMKAAGCEPRRVHVVVDGKRTTVSAWTLPGDLG